MSKQTAAIALAHHPGAGIDLDAPGVEPLPGGVSSEIGVIVTPQGPIVVKRALPKLNVAADWRSDPGRAAIEARALRAASDLLGQLHVPRVLWEDPARHRFAMPLADPSLRNWKQDLIAGRVDQRTATAAGTLLGRLHARSAGEAALATAFDDRGPFHELRVVPFFDRVAERLPDLAAPIASVVRQMAMRRRVLVHGDYSPKNILADGARIMVLDFEVAHWGDPAFDVAFCLAHLTLKRWRRGADAEALRQAATGFLAAYAQAAGDVCDDWGHERGDDRHLARLLGCLLLARIDGDSPADYLGDLDIGAAREAARALLIDPPLRGVARLGDCAMPAPGS